jgi:hypothetical protein
MSIYLGSIRVSTAQDERGVSLQEQGDAILPRAECHKLEISRWFEKREPAVKRGRPFFNKTPRLLRNGKANGAMIRKIDRSLAAFGSFVRLPRQTLADYGIRYGTYRRGTPGILRYLEKDVQGGSRDRRSAKLRFPPHRALRPACETSAIGQGIFCLT